MDEVKRALIGLPVTNQAAIDAKLWELDGTKNAAKLGGNLMIGVSAAALRAAAETASLPLWQHLKEQYDLAPQAAAPRLFVNLINGGQHAKGGACFQEYQIIPDTDDLALALAVAKSVKVELAKLLREVYQEEPLVAGDEGGLVTKGAKVTEPLDWLQKAISAADAPVPVTLGLDVAASSFYENSHYQIDDQSYTAGELSDFYADLLANYPDLKAIEDPFAEDDSESFAAFREQHERVLTIGDDLTTTNAESLKAAISTNAINAVIIKPNQVGTITDTLKTIRLAYEHDVKCIVSHRSGETKDDFIADLAWGTGSYGFKAGAPDVPERQAKYDRLLEIAA